MSKGVWNQILTYLYIRKKDKDDPSNIDIKLMHGMNRISLIVFLIAIVIIVVKAIVNHL